MTYNVFGGTLSLTQSLNPRSASQYQIIPLGGIDTCEQFAQSRHIKAKRRRVKPTAGRLRIRLLIINCRSVMK